MPDLEKKFCIELGTTKSKAEKRLYDIKPNDGNYFNKDGSRSDNFVPFYFSAISLIIKKAINILEIGTGMGLITNLLANLFPTSTIYTVDIPTDDKDYEKLAWRARSEENMKQFKRNITSRDNIKYIEVNSFFLSSMRLPRKFDLIFVDGGHNYPVVAWDVMFAYNSLRSNGFLFFHDHGGYKREVTITINYIKDIINEEIKIARGTLIWLKKLDVETILVPIEM